jgi:hypothetical protein
MITIENKDGIDVVVHSDLPGWARPASPDEVALGARIAELEKALRSIQNNVMCPQFFRQIASNALMER